MAVHPADDSSRAGGRFATTQWSLVRAAAGGEPGADDAFARLCEKYWRPLYAFVRRQGHNPADAQDLTQAFFARLTAKRDFGGADPARAKFRSYLLAALKHFLANEWDKERAQKRGGGRKNFTSLDLDDAERRYRAEPADDLTPERLYERQWALTLLADVLREVRGAYAAEGKAGVFEALKGALTGEDSGAGYAEIGAALGLNEGAVKVAVHRLRKRYREALRARIADTVEDPSEVDGEVRHLFSVLAG